jgi:SAM-dependent methyltransferase
MQSDYRLTAADYYDKFCGPPPGDVDFYGSRVTPQTRVLELGCGTGRVLVPLAKRAGYVHGLDHSPAMLEICRRKIHAAGLDANEATAEVADITDFDLTRQGPKFDLIIAPFRVMQNLETDAEITGLMDCIRTHLAPGGKAILNTFCPRGPVDELKAFWDSRDGGKPTWSQPDGSDTVEMTDICTRYRENPLVVYPELTYRRYDEVGKQTDEATLEIAMRVWYPDQLLTLIESHGFEVVDRFGGYQGEPWPSGSELVVVFTHARQGLQ